MLKISGGCLLFLVSAGGKNGILSRLGNVPWGSMNFLSLIGNK